MIAPTTIRTEGGLLPPDFLQRLTGLQAHVPGLTPDSYHVTGEKLNEAASRAWNRLLGMWTAFQSTAEALPASDPATTVTREKWLLPLFAELGYGRLQPAKAIDIDGQSYPVSHAWQHVPVHLVGRNVDLDRRTAGIAGAARTSPHGLVQEVLNRRTESLWGFVSNGLKLRLLRDNRSLTRQAYLEFDLAAMMEGQAFSDFVVLWLLCHQSRVEGDPPESCWLEKWATAAREQGTRALDELRDGVETAIQALGRGFLRHPGNGTLLENLRSGALDRQDYYRQLLRLVYRLIFLFVAETRELLLLADAPSAAAQRYRRYYSIVRLRELAGQRRGTPHGDLWESLLVVFRGLSSEHGVPELGLPALGSLLWSDATAPDIDNKCRLANADLLEAIRALGFRVERGLRRPVDWRNLGPEELGSVYESLLELHPEVNTGSGTFSLRIAAGHERKTTGSYYTPTSLVESLLDSALEPVLNEAVRATDPERAILDLKICDPACGSGHFLIAAAHRIAKRLAAVRTGDSEPSPQAVRAALRDVIGHCLYGVDANRMAVELCKVNLWLEALTPGRPLSFLDHHIQGGNSLLGATPALLRGGIPDAAFDPVEGDDREYSRELMRRNRREREGFRNLFTGEPWERLGDLATGLANLDDIDDSTLDGVRQKEARYAEIVRSTGYAHGRLWADPWCAAFAWLKTRDAHPLTEDLFRTIERNPMAAPEIVRRQIQRIAEEYRFFHWHLAFPDVFRVLSSDAPLRDSAGWSGGFDVVLGNPPWEQAQVSEKEFFASRSPEIAALPGDSRKRAIRSLRESDPDLLRAFNEFRRSHDVVVHLLRDTGRFPLCATGKLNTYAIFAELNRSLLRERGQAGFVVPAGIATDDTTKEFFETVVQTQGLVSLYGFENEERVFPGVHHAFRFCLLTLSGRGRPQSEPEFAFFLRQVSDLKESQRRFRLESRDFRLLNPNTRTCPIFRTRRDAGITTEVYRRVPVLVNEADGESGDPWQVSFSQGLFNMTGASALFRTAAQLLADGWTLRGNIFERDRHRYLPLYEAKMLHHFDHRFGTYAGQTEAQARQNKLPELSDEQHANPSLLSLPEYWVPQEEVEDRLAHRWNRQWLLGWRDITGTEKVRTVISSVIPRVGVGHTVPLFLSAAQAERLPALLANLCAFAFDYIARQKVGGTHLTYSYLKQLPVLPPATIDQAAPWSRDTSIRAWVSERVLELVFTACDLQAFGRDLGWDGPPFRWDASRRFLLRCELDAAFFHLYGIARADVEYIMETFPIVRRNDEDRHAEYRTKRVILEIYDRMQHSIDSRESYQTLLDPPPADPHVAHRSAEPQQA